MVVLHRRLSIFANTNSKHAPKLTEHVVHRTINFQSQVMLFEGSIYSQL